MRELIVTVNAGSSSIKLASYSHPDLKPQQRITTSNKEEAFGWLASQGAGQFVAFGHRVVHGGQKFYEPTLVDDDTLAELKRLTPLATLHEPGNIAIIESLSEYYPAVPHIACFDTAFHRTLPLLERRLPLPAEFHSAGIMRYGFHGLSYQSIASRLPDMLGDKAEGRVIVAHLGGASSMCGMINRESRAVTMGFSTMDGLMMNTRPGSLDAGVVLHLISGLGVKPTDAARMLYNQSGLKGISGISGDMRELLASADGRARFAVEMYCYLAAKHAGSLAVAIGGIDALVFTGGIGENAAGIRESIASRLRFLGRFDTHVIPTDEESVIARAACAMLESIAFAA